MSSTCTKREGEILIARIEAAPWWPAARAKGWTAEWCGGQFTGDAPGWVRVAFWICDDVAHAPGPEAYAVLQHLRAMWLDVELVSVRGHVFWVTPVLSVVA